ncbi:MAG: alpha/beta fold hydrolase [Deltaproteobacteria bacterium]|nr:alpha/beta fold hydrolase [Deltaproteobacteria bacterium]
MNRFAYRTTGLAIKALENISRANVRLHDAEKVPDHNNIFVINHFTRIETLLMPSHLFKLTQVPIWSLAAPELFKGALAGVLDNLGAVSTRSPDRDLLVVRSLLLGEAMWIIFPEGRMVKNKKIVEKGRYMISYAGGKHPPHTGAATLALRTEFYRQRLLTLLETSPDEAGRLLKRFKIESSKHISEKTTSIVPVNITYYPIRAKENALSNLASKLVENLPERVVEEFMTEGAMLLSGVDMDIRFGDPIDVRDFLKPGAIRSDIEADRKINFDDILPSRRLMRKKALNIMQQYMASIYNMTTVNPDHVFASILLKRLFSRMSVADFKRRAFLAVSADLERMQIFCHESLQHEQQHLLIDDRYGRYRDFIAMALEKGCVAEKNGMLVKSSKVVDVFDFHMARVNNPVSVIANEVEPLAAFQKHIRRIARMPAIFVRRNIVGMLMKRAKEEYAEDYRTYYVEGESKGLEVGMPYLARGRGRGMGVLLIHGYMAAPLEVRELAVYLQKLGYWVYTPRLKGHGTSPDDLALRSYRDWLASVETGCAIMSNICRRVVVGGFSTGAGLALHLAARVKEAAGVFAVSAPMRLNDLSARFAPALDTWNRLMDKFSAGAAKKEFVENNPENPHINYFRNPIAGVRELERLMEELETLLPDVTIPTLVIQSDSDPVVNPKGARRIFKKVGAEDKEFILFNIERHGILLGEGSERVHKRIGSFIDRLK